MGSGWFGSPWYGTSGEDVEPSPSNTGGIMTTAGFTYVDEDEEIGDHRAVEIAGKVVVI